MIFELAVFDFETFLGPNIKNVNRIELCKNYSVGGITPDNDLIHSVLLSNKIDVFLMLRCRPGNFIYKKTEIEDMLLTLEYFKSLNIQGIVFGALTKGNEIDKHICNEIISAAYPLPVTFHRAFDLCNDLYKSAEDIIKCGFRRILTSGSDINAFEGRFKIKELNKRYSKDIIIIPGGGIRNNNLMEILDVTEAREVHSSHILQFRNK